MLEDPSLSQAWPGVRGRRSGREDQRDRSDNSSHLTNNPFPLLIKPGPPLPGAQVGLPGRLWR